jgi:hypothetical protein
VARGQLSSFSSGSWCFQSPLFPSRVCSSVSMRGGPPQGRGSSKERLVTRSPSAPKRSKLQTETSSLPSEGRHHDRTCSKERSGPGHSWPYCPNPVAAFPSPGNSQQRPVSTRLIATKHSVSTSSGRNAQFRQWPPTQYSPCRGHLLSVSSDVIAVAGVCEAPWWLCKPWWVPRDMPRPSMVGVLQVLVRES